MTDFDRELWDLEPGQDPGAGEESAHGAGSSGTRGPGVGRRRAARRPLGDESFVPQDLLEQYVRSLGAPRILTRQETYDLAREMEAARDRFLEEVYAVPGTAVKVLERWHERRSRGHVTAALHARYRDPAGGDCGRRIDLALGRLDALLARWGELARARGSRARAQRAEAESEIAKQLQRADLSFEMVIEVFRELWALRGARRTRRVAETRRRLALTTPAARAHLARAQAALARLDALKQTFVRHNLRLVIKQAKRYRGLGVPYVDLIQEGNLGLIRAVEKFDHRRGFAFSTYAVWWIDQALVRAIQNTSRTVRVPSHIYELQMRHRNTAEELRQRLGRAPTQEELEKALALEPGALDRLVETEQPISSTQAELPGTGGEFTIEDVLADDEAVDPIDEIDRVEMARRLGEAVATLGAREREIVELRFGLRGSEPVTLQVIGERLGLSRERVRQLETRALTRLREVTAVRKLAGSIHLAHPVRSEEPAADCA